MADTKEILDILSKLTNRIEEIERQKPEPPYPASPEPQRQAAEKEEGMKRREKGREKAPPPSKLEYLTHNFSSWKEMLELEEVKIPCNYPWKPPPSAICWGCLRPDNPPPPTQHYHTDNCGALFRKHRRHAKDLNSLDLAPTKTGEGPKAGGIEYNLRYHPGKHDCTCFLNELEW
jgi:hypothetical protein